VAHSKEKLRRHNIYLYDGDYEYLRDSETPDTEEIEV